MGARTADSQLSFGVLKIRNGTAHPCMAAYGRLNILVVAYTICLPWAAGFRMVRKVNAGLHAMVKTLPDNMLKVSIRIKWTPGQNVFVRFLGLGPHSPVHGRFHTDRGSPFPRHGVARAIAEGKMAKSMRVFVDCPYGGLVFLLEEIDTV